MNLSLEQKKKILERWKQSPIVRHYDFSDKKLWGKQEEVLWAVRNHKRVAVKSGNTVGKSWLAADVAMDFLLTNYPSKVITTAPTWGQVVDILWKEIASYYRNSKIPIGGELLTAGLKFNDEWFAQGISTDEVYRMQGRHSPHLLVIIDEASGVVPEIWEAVESLHPERVLAIGNPNEITGNFFEAFKSDLWHKISISGQECVDWQNINGKIPGLVTQDWINERAQDWGRNSPEYKIHVVGEFPDETEDTLISRKWVEDARNRVNEDDHEEDADRILAADIATKHGASLTVVGYRYGHTVPWMRGYKQLAINDSGNVITSEHSKRDTQVIVIDSDGVGEGLSDYLLERRLPINEFHGGYGYKSMDQNRFKNLRSQFYWIVAKKFEKGMYSLKGLDPQVYETLKNQLCSINRKNPDSMGRIQIETKEDMAARGIKSPDFADTMMMCEYGWYMSRIADVKSYVWR